jgi:hypothetical protein
VALSIDAKRFDQHVRQEALKATHHIYGRLFKGRDRAVFMRLLSWCLQTKGSVRCPDGTVIYQVDAGNRCSGDFDTGFGNVLIVCLILWQYFCDLGVQFELLDDGDDCTIIIEEEDLPLLDGLQGHFLTYGFQIKRERVAKLLERLRFCQCHPIFDGRRWVMVRNLAAVAKDCAVVGTPPSMAAWTDAVSQCGEAVAGGIPVWNSFYQYLRRCADFPGRHHRRLEYSSLLESTGLWWMAKGMRRRFEPPSDAARVSFFKAFGVSPEAQIACEEWYDQNEFRLTAETLDWPVHPGSPLAAAPLTGPAILA